MLKEFNSRLAKAEWTWRWVTSYYQVREEKKNEGKCKEPKQVIWQHCIHYRSPRKRREKERDRELIWMTAKNFPNLRIEMNVLIQAQGSLTEKVLRDPHQTQHSQTVESQTKKNLESREKSNLLYTNLYKVISKFLTINLKGKKAMR